MAIYHLSVKPVSRGEGRSATAAAAYRAAERIHDQKLGIDYDYTRKRGVEYSEIVLSTAATKQDVQWARDRQQLWNAAEAAEKRKDARIAREYEIALPAEMNAGQRLQLTRSFAKELADRYNCAVDIAIHAPHRKGDDRNHHAHLLATTREVTPTGLGEKTSIELSNTDRQRRGLQSGALEITEIRSRWKDLTNEHLQSLGLETRIDHRSLQAQGVEREPTTHLGPAVHGMQRRGVESEVGYRLADEARERLERAQELGNLERETQQISRSILILDQDINAAVQAREAGRKHENAELERAPRTPEVVTNGYDPEVARQEARERWREYRAGLELANGEERTRAQETPGQIVIEIDSLKKPSHDYRIERKGLEMDLLP